MIDDDDTATAPPPKDKKPANIAPDAVKDPNEKTDGKPGLGTQGKPSSDGETDPGSS